jgi:signal transduction histidine kinase
MFFFTHAAMFGSSHNWVTVSGIGWLIGTGMQVPKNVMVYIMHYSELEQEIISNTTIVVVIMVNLIALIVFFFILGRVFKKNRYIITEKGLVVRS